MLGGTQLDFITISIADLDCRILSSVWEASLTVPDKKIPYGSGNQLRGAQSGEPVASTRAGFQHILQWQENKELVDRRNRANAFERAGSSSAGRTVDLFVIHNHLQKQPIARLKILLAPLLKASVAVSSYVDAKQCCICTQEIYVGHDNKVGNLENLVAFYIQRTNKTTAMYSLLIPSISSSLNSPRQCLPSQAHILSRQLEQTPRDLCNHPLPLCPAL